MKKYSCVLAVLFLAFIVLGGTSWGEDELDQLFEDTESSQLNTSQKKENTVAAKPPANITKAQVSYVEGEVRRRNQLDPDWIPVKEKTEVESQGKVRTLVQSRAEILLDQEKAIRLAPKTTVDLLKLYQEQEQKIATTINVEEGEVWANIAKLDDTMTLAINSKLTTAAVRGTIFNFQVTQQGATKIKVYRGLVEVYNPFPENTQTSGDFPAVQAPREVRGPDEVPGPEEVTREQWTKIVLGEMQTLSLGPDDKTPTVSDFSADDPAEQNDWVRWNQERDKLKAAAEK